MPEIKEHKRRLVTNLPWIKNGKILVKNTYFLGYKIRHENNDTYTVDKLEIYGRKSNFPTIIQAMDAIEYFKKDIRNKPFEFKNDREYP